MNKFSEQPFNCLSCGRFLVDLHHVKTQGAGGNDENYNLMPLCREHHTEVHTIGLNSFSERYIKVYQWLINNGWEFFELTGKWIRFNKG